MPEWLFLLVEDPWSAMYNHAWVLALLLTIGIAMAMARRHHGLPATVRSPRGLVVVT